MPTVTSSLKYHMINPDNSISSSAAKSSVRLINVNKNYNTVNNGHSGTLNAVSISDYEKISPSYAYNSYSNNTANLTRPSKPPANQQIISNENNPIYPIGASNNISPIIQN